MPDRNAYQRELIKDANSIGLVILAFGLKEKSPVGFFRRDMSIPDIAKRVIETHEPVRGTYYAAKDYMRGYQALIDNSDLKLCRYNADAQRRFKFIAAKLEGKLLDGLLSSYSSLVRAQNEKQKQERRNERSRLRAKRAAATRKASCDARLVSIARV